MNNYPIEGLMNTAMNEIKEMVDVNTIIGDPIETNNGVVIIPVSKVNFGFAAGGSEFDLKNKNDEKANKDESNNRLPFGGGSGAGVSINPIGFIVVQPTGVKLLSVEHSSSLDKLLDLVPDLMDKLNRTIEKKINKDANKVDYKFSYTNTKEKNKDIDKNNIKNSNDNNNSNNNTKNNNTEEQNIKYEIEYDETSDM